MRSELNETPSLIRSFRRLRIPSIVFTCKRAARLSSPSHRRLRFVREAGLLPRPGFAVNIFFSPNRPASPPSDPPHLPARSAVSTVFTKPCQPLFFGSFQKLTASSSHLPHHPSGLQRSAVSTELTAPCQPLFLPFRCRPFEACLRCGKARFLRPPAASVNRHYGIISPGVVNNLATSSEAHSIWI